MSTVFVLWHVDDVARVYEDKNRAEADCVLLNEEGTHLWKISECVLLDGTLEDSVSRRLADVVVQNIERGSPF